MNESREDQQLTVIRSSLLEVTVASRRGKIKAAFSFRMMFFLSFNRCLEHCRVYHMNGYVYMCMYRSLTQNNLWSAGIFVPTAFPAALFHMFFRNGTWFGSSGIPPGQKSRSVCTMTINLSLSLSLCTVFYYLYSGESWTCFSTCCRRKRSPGSHVTFLQSCFLLCLEWSSGSTKRCVSGSQRDHERWVLNTARPIRRSGRQQESSRDPVILTHLKYRTFAQTQPPFIPPKPRKDTLIVVNYQWSDVVFPAVALCPSPTRQPETRPAEALNGGCFTCEFRGAVIKKKKKRP